MRRVLRAKEWGEEIGDISTLENDMWAAAEIKDINADDYSKVIKSILFKYLTLS